MFGDNPKAFKIATTGMSPEMAAVELLSNTILTFDLILRFSISHQKKRFCRKPQNIIEFMIEILIFSFVSLEFLLDHEEAAKKQFIRPFNVASNSVFPPCISHFSLDRIVFRNENVKDFPTKKQNRISFVCNCFDCICFHFWIMDILGWTVESPNFPNHFHWHLVGYCYYDNSWLWRFFSKIYTWLFCWSVYFNIWVDTFGDADSNDCIQFQQDIRLL